MGLSGQSSRASDRASAAGLFADAAPSWNLYTEYEDVKPDIIVRVTLLMIFSCGHDGSATEPKDMRHPWRVSGQSMFLRWHQLPIGDSRSEQRGTVPTLCMKLPAQ